MSKSDAQAKFISLWSILTGSGTFLVSLYVYFHFREPFKKLVEQNDQIKLGRLVDACQWCLFVVAALSFVLVVSNAYFLAYVIKAAKTRANEN